MALKSSGPISRQRVIDHGEVYTPSALVNDMLDLVAHECERIDSRFLEPACGNGNFLAEVLRRKLLAVDKQNGRDRQRWERDAVLAVCSIYGIDLLLDNIAACRERLLNVVADAYSSRFKTPLPELARGAVRFILSRNVVQGDALSFKQSDGEPIVFSEWSPLNGALLKRRDFKYDHLLDHAAHAGRGTLFHSDEGEPTYLPTPCGERPACHYLKVADAEAGPIS